MELSVSDRALTGRLFAPDGRKLAEITVPVTSNAAVTSGSALLFTSGLEVQFRDGDSRDSGKPHPYPSREK